MFGIGVPELVVIFVVAVLYVGPVVVVCGVLYTIWRIRKGQDAIRERATSIEALLKARDK